MANEKEDDDESQSRVSVRASRCDQTDRDQHSRLSNGRVRPARSAPNEQTHLSRDAIARVLLKERQETCRLALRRAALASLGE